jgi:hypothetical protein
MKKYLTKKRNRVFSHRIKFYTWRRLKIGLTMQETDIEGDITTF